MADFIILAVVALIVGGAVAYIVKEKKKGKKCIGCPDTACGCSHNCGGCHGCGNLLPENKEAQHPLEKE